MPECAIGGASTRVHSRADSISQAKRATHRGATCSQVRPLEALEMAQDAAAGDRGFFEVGFEPMDALHRDFHELMAALREPGDHGEKLLALHEHLLRHCSQEERWMRATNFPARAAHEREHEMLLEVVAEVRRRFDAGDSDIVARLAEELPRWFEDHANAMDAALAVHLRNLDGAAIGTPDAREAVIA